MATTNSPAEIKETTVKVAATAALLPQNPADAAPTGAGSLVSLGAMGMVWTLGSVAVVGGGGRVSSINRVVAGCVRRMLAEADSLVSLATGVITALLAIGVSKIEGDSENVSLCDEADVDDVKVVDSDKEVLMEVGGGGEGEGWEGDDAVGIIGDELGITSLLEETTSEDDGAMGKSVGLAGRSTGSEADEFDSWRAKRRSELGLR